MSAEAFFRGICAYAISIKILCAGSYKKIVANIGPNENTCVSGNPTLPKLTGET